MELATVAVEVGIAISGVIGTAIVYSFRVGKLVTQIEILEEKITKHVEVDERHHQEEQRQWQDINRSLGQIEGALDQSSNPRQSRNKSRP